MGPFVAGKGRLKRKLNELEEFFPASELETAEKTNSSNRTDTEKFKRMKLSARGLLATLSMRKISIKNIKFNEGGSTCGGSFADVAIATFVRATRGWQGKRFAVKKLRFVINSDMTEEKFFRLFANELRLLDKLSHPNIVRIIGFVEDMKDRIAWLIFPWEENGNLREFLQSGKWEIPERVSLIRDVARGLQYLHTRDPPICHGDLKSLNILVNSSHHAVITDFGSARIIRGAQELGTPPSSHPSTSGNDAVPRCNEHPELKVSVSNKALTLTGPAWSFRWAPPEVLEGGMPNLATDIWALGWIAWEAITDSYPFEELDSELTVTSRVVEGHLPSIYEQDQLSQIHMLCNSMQTCWKLDLNERPSATECWKTIRWIPHAIPVIKQGEQSATRSAALLQQIGEMHRLQSRPEEASKALQRGLTIARATGNRATLGELLIALARNDEAQFSINEAEKFYTEAWTTFESIGHERGIANALLGLGYVQQARFKYIQAESLYTKALKIFKTIGDDSGRGNALRVLGDVQLARSQYVEAESSFAEALAIYSSIGEDLGRANVFHGLGDVQQARSKYVDAESFYSRALAIYKSMGNDLGGVSALLKLGDAQQAVSRYNEAESSYAEALVMSKSIGHELGRAKALRRLGGVQRAGSRYDAAESSYVEAVAIYKSIGVGLGQANASLGLGDVQRAHSKYTDAELSYSGALAIYTSLGNDVGRVTALLRIGDAQQAGFRNSEAESSFAEALDISKRIGYKLGRARALRRLGDVQRIGSRYTAAGSSYVEALAIYKSIGDDRGRVTLSLGLAQVRFRQAQYAEAKQLVKDVAPISSRLGYAWGIQTSEALLKAIFVAESSRLSTRSLTLASLISPMPGSGTMKSGPFPLSYRSLVFTPPTTLQSRSVYVTPRRVAIGF